MIRGKKENPRSELSSSFLFKFGALSLFHKPYMKKMVGAGNGLFYPILGIASCVAFLYLSFGDDLKVSYHNSQEPGLGFVQRNGTQFMVDGRPFYINGWNSFWLMDHFVDDDRRPRVGAMLQAGAKMGFTVCRTWAFNDGGYNALQISPGQFDERVFKALDNVIAQAKQHGIRLLLSLVNNLKAYGGKTQYVNWAWEEGIGLSSSNDSFFYDPSIKKYFKHFVKAVLTRKNTVTGIEYRNDPTIFGWELMNEPQCSSDPSGDTLQDWIEEMSAFVKSIDKNHLLTVGLEGFYGPKNPKRLTVNPNPWASELGSDFVRNSKISAIDFASVHIYPDHWAPDQEFEDKLKFVSKWMLSHIEDGHYELNKPIFFTEFGLSNLNKGFQPDHRDRFYRTVFDIIYKSAKRNRAGAGALVWQLFVEGMEEFNDDFGIVPWERQSTYKILTEQSCRMARINGNAQRNLNLKELCLQKQ
ncbi:Mannan endo-1,4-beta-mannosidase 2 [Turnera subulata]|uniref:mannan endo-1,4-beta-mannosidase n=1 Tax=Turnera subulata TaxID=218843 RepID=A0A9Q0F2S0_9ROSI|nr:Mannan endo-1,4-beta-mannosidase 2 [Turnera subulata]